MVVDGANQLPVARAYKKKVEDLELFNGYKTIISTPAGGTVKAIYYLTCFYGKITFLGKL